MSNKVATFNVMIRVRIGKEGARAIRRAGLIPAVIYGNKQAPVSIAIDPRPINAEINKHGFFTRMLSLTLDGTNISTICREIQRHPVSGIVLHADFQRIGIDSIIHVSVPVHVINEELSPGIKRGGMVNLVEHAIEVIGRPAAIPSALVIDVTGLKIGDSIHLGQIKLPVGVRLLHPEQNITIATIVAPSSMKTEEKTTEESSTTM